MRRADVLVIGGGHAGAEAALAAARLGCEALLVTMTLDTIGQMSCTPAIGGLAKGQLVREIDALGGVMGLAADATGLQFRMLNAAKGPAVRSPRAQCDKWAYQHWIKNVLERSPGVRLLQDRVTAVLTEGGAGGGPPRAVGVRTAAGLEIGAGAVVLAAGTFPGGKTHIGASTAPGGRFGEPPAGEIADSLRALNLPLLRLKTGTCPRVNARSVDFSRMEIQPGDADPRPFSFLTDRLEVEQLPCWLTWTTPETHAAVREVLDRAPLFTGQIEGVGPRYCPSFELKLVRFPDRDRHHVYVEPEGRNTEELYLNGLATSIDPAAQVRMVRSIPGLERAEITRWGYAVEYDAVSPLALGDTLETRAVAGLYSAGQSNGTSGYEEAAAQGLLAGANAALAVQGRAPFRLGRHEAYIGVLVDDLVTRGTEEPYRLFTSRAEYRLLLRQDNADLRLTPLAREIGLVGDERAGRVARLREEIAGLRATLEGTRREGKTLREWLKRPEIGWAELAAFPEASALGAASARAAELLAVEARYEGYIRRHEAEIARVARAESAPIPADLDYGALEGMRREAREKLARIRPTTVGRAGRVSGVSPSDLAVLTIAIANRGAPRVGTHEAAPEEETTRP